ncbi:MAG TPA: ABC transporter permease [Acidobacteriaceae bacterium]|nr:ABC transporter permease [Acidobacteriaceae bacterium]
MSNFLSELKIAARYLLKSPGFALTAVLMLALGIGATTAIFSIVEGVLLRPLPFPHSDRLYALGDVLEGVSIGGFNGNVVTVPDIVNYTRDTHSFVSLGGYQPAGFELSGSGQPAMISAANLTAGVLPALGVQPLMGRFFTQQEQDQKVQVALLSYSTWKKRFDGDPNILGKKLLLDRKPYTVIGVMPRNFEFPLVPGRLNQSELWVPFQFTQQDMTTGAANWSYRMVGRLKPGVTVNQALQDATRVANETMRNYPAFMAGMKIHPAISSLQAVTVKFARPLIRTLFLAVAVVLLIACANLAGLLLVRSIRRRKEIAVRLALGAQSHVLLRQAVLESLVLSITGGILGIGLASLALNLGVKFLPDTLPLINDIRFNWAVAAFALALGIATGLICGIAPAFAAMRTRVNETLKEGGRSGSAGAGHGRLRSALVIAEIAIALMLLTASGLLLRSFQKMRNVDLGYEPDHTLVAGYNLPQKQYSTQPSVDQFNKELLLKLQALPGVKQVGLTSLVPAGGSNNNEAILPEGYVPPNHTYDLATSIQVEGDYFKAVGIPLLRGRLLTPDDNANSQLVVVVNHMLAEQSWPGQNPIGKRLRIGLQNMQTPWMVVVGEVANVKEGSPDAPTKQEFYVPVAQAEKDIGSLASPTDLNGNGGYIAVRTAMPPQLMENALRSTVRSIDPQLPLTQMQAMTQALSDTEAPRRFNTFLISAFAVAAVLLAILGIYSVIAFSVALRTQEMAIRMALGSQRTGIIRLILISGAKLGAIGCALGIAGALASSRLLQSLLFGVSPFDPVTLSLAVVLILLLVLAASFVPARRAAAIHPMRALREE